LGVDDVAFVSALLDELARAHRVDPDRVFATGISNGAMMSGRLACDLADRIAGVAMIAGTMPRSLQPSCAPKRPVSVMLLHGTEDPIVPYDGGEVKIRGLAARGMVVSAEATVSEWVRHDGCDPVSEERQIPDVNPSDGSTIRVQSWSRCKDGVTVELWRVQGGGHTWPGGWQYLNERFIGTTNRDIDGRDEIWRFFAAHPRARAAGS
jgi:polyhydroxybutyrate depolymerase